MSERFKRFGKSGLIMLFGALMASAGIDAMIPGHVAGGPIVWISSLMASALLLGFGIYIGTRQA